jgi:hypothetical protein
MSFRLTTLSRNVLLVAPGGGLVTLTVFEPVLRRFLEKVFKEQITRHLSPPNKPGDDGLQGLDFPGL